MSLILAIEPDRRQSAKVAALAEQLRVELVIGESADVALQALGSRVPDVVLTSQLLLPRDETALAERLRELGAAGAHVQTLVIPVLRGDEKGRKKKGGGFLGRLRRAAPDEEKNQDGCDPAVFAAEINEYLERGAAERAALAAAQADLEAAWAEQPAPAPTVQQSSAALAEAAADAPLGAAPTAVDAQPSAPTVSSMPLYATVDVHPDMVIDDPEALFGEFAAIPIKRVAPEPRLDAAIAASPGPDPVDDSVLAPASETPVVRPRQRDEDWEEIPLDDGDLDRTPGWPTSSDAPPPPQSGVELKPESLDLEEFVRALDTVTSSANAQPMIPLVDLTHVLAGDIDVPEPTVVEARELLEEARAMFEAEVTAVFASESVTDVSFDQPREATAAASADADDALSADATAVSFESSPEPAPVLPKLEWPEFPAPQPMPAPTWQERPQTDWRAAIDALPPPPMARPADANATTAPPELKAGWQDMLSAIRRDIKSLKADETAATPTPPKPDFHAEPLVFPSRPAVAASVLSEFDATTAQRSREPEESVRQAERLAREAQDRARAVEEALRAAAAAVATSKIVEAAEPLPIDSSPSIFNAKIDTDLTAVAFEPIVPIQPARPESTWPTFSPAIEPPVSAVGHDDGAAIADHDLTATFFAAAPAPTMAVPAIDRVAEDVTSLFAATQAEPAGTATPATAPPAPAGPATVPGALDWLVSAPAPAGAAGTPVGTEPPVDDGGPFVDQPTTVPLFTASAAVAPPAPPPEPMPMASTPPSNASRQKQGKGKKKRRHGLQQPQTPPEAPSDVYGPIPEWGFFDPQRAGFGPLLARLDRMSSDLRALPRR